MASAAARGVVAYHASSRRRGSVDTHGRRGSTDGARRRGSNDGTRTPSAGGAPAGAATGSYNGPTTPTMCPHCGKNVLELPKVVETTDTDDNDMDDELLPQSCPLKWWTICGPAGHGCCRMTPSTPVGVDPDGQFPFYQKGGVDKLPLQKKIRDFYQDKPIQLFVAFLILANFIASACYSELLPEKGTPRYDLFKTFEYFFTFAFLLELLVNMYGSFFVQFYMDGWNWFDFVIVMISILALVSPNLPAISVLRLFRAFRVVRLFKRIKEMRKIVDGVMKSLPPMLYAVIALVLIMGIWAIMGVEFFQDLCEFGECPDDGTGDPGYYFGRFFKAMLSLFQIMTFDSWSSGISREIIYVYPLAAVYFITYVFTAGIVLANVLISILLDTYMSMGDEMQNEELEENMKGTVVLGPDNVGEVLNDSVDSLLQFLSVPDTFRHSQQGRLLIDALAAMLLTARRDDSGDERPAGAAGATAGVAGGGELADLLRSNKVPMTSLVDYLRNGGGLNALQEHHAKAVTNWTAKPKDYKAVQAVENLRVDTSNVGKATTSPDFTLEMARRNAPTKATEARDLDHTSERSTDERVETSIASLTLL